MRCVYDAEDRLIMHKMDQLWRSGIIIEIEIFVNLDLCHSLIPRPSVKSFVKSLPWEIFYYIKIHVLTTYANDYIENQFADQIPLPPLFSLQLRNEWCHSSNSSDSL